MRSLPALLLALLTPPVSDPPRPTQTTQAGPVRITIPVRNMTSSACEAVRLSAPAPSGDRGPITFPAPPNPVVPAAHEGDWDFAFDTRAALRVLTDCAPTGPGASPTRPLWHGCLTRSPTG